MTNVPTPELPLISTGVRMINRILTVNPDAYYLDKRGRISRSQPPGIQIGWYDSAADPCQIYTNWPHDETHPEGTLRPVFANPMFNPATGKMDVSGKKYRWW